MSVNILYQGKVIASGIVLADNFWTRLSGYMFRSAPHVPGILFEPGAGMHTSFMKFDLDLVFLSKENKIVKVVWKMKPWRHTWFYFNAKRTLEMPTGVLPPILKEGDVLEVVHV